MRSGISFTGLEELVTGLPGGLDTKLGRRLDDEQLRIKKYR